VNAQDQTDKSLEPYGRILIDYTALTMQGRFAIIPCNAVEIKELTEEDRPL
jgi:hypothetical protein